MTQPNPVMWILFLILLKIGHGHQSRVVLVRWTRGPSVSTVADAVATVPAVMASTFTAPASFQFWQCGPESDVDHLIL